MRDSSERLYFGEERDPLRPQTQTWLPGGPPGLSFAAVIQDRAAYRELECGDCRRRGLDLKPQHTTSGRYRILAVCPHCGEQEVL